LVRYAQVYKKIFKGRKMNITSLKSFSIVFALIFISLTNPIIAEKNYLSEEFIKSHPNLKNRNQAEKNVENILKELAKLKTSKNQEDYLQKIQYGLDVYPDPNFYYLLGNYYMNLNSFDNAIKSHNLAILRRFNNEHLAYYNIACSYSLLKNKEKAFEFLIKALLSGYRNLEHIANDKDLNFLKNTDEWIPFKKNYLQIVDLKKYHGSYNIDDTGKSELLLCKNNIAIEPSFYRSKIDGSCCGTGNLEKPLDSHLRGIWRKTEDKIIIFYNTRCGYKGEGRKKEIYAGDCGPEYAQCSLKQICVTTTPEQFYYSYKVINLDNNSNPDSEYKFSTLYPKACKEYESLVNE
ncbi:TPR end-of-group domain-containing protein, partial [Leptospira kanakyensis]